MKLVVRSLLNEWRGFEKMKTLNALELDGKWILLPGNRWKQIKWNYDIDESSEVGECEIEDAAKPLSEQLDESDLINRVQEIADKNGLGKIAKLLKTMTEREIAEELCQSVSAIHKKIEKLRRLCKGLDAK